MESKRRIPSSRALKAVGVCVLRLSIMVRAVVQSPFCIANRALLTHNCPILSTSGVSVFLFPQLASVNAVIANARPVKNANNRPLIKKERA